jgi:glutamate-1-semialdehyde 2,1-aminomutase
MTDLRHERLLQGLYRDYEARFPRSKAAHARARGVLIDGISHGARLFTPYPFRITAAEGAYVTDLDGHRILDYWQGHYANILGHNPPSIRQALAAELEHGLGLQTGLPDELQVDFCALLAQTTGAERVRLTTAGTLATMYAMMLSRAFTGRRIVLKVAGGWHGANPLALKGVSRKANGFDEVDSAGVPDSTHEEVLVTRFNDTQRLYDLFAEKGDQIACFIMEPCPSHAGFISATGEYMRAARELTQRHGALLILDEVITGFRFCPGPMFSLYGVQPDLATYGKVIGGGMPISAIAGRADVMQLASEEHPQRVWFNGGTFSSHPLSLLAGKVMIEHLVAHAGEIYPALAAKGEQLRCGVERVFAERGVLARCTGHTNDVLQGSSLGMVYFPRRADLTPTSAEDLDDPALCDNTLRNQALKLGLLLNDVNVMSGLGALAMSHGDRELAHTLAAFDAFAQRLMRERS